MKRFEKKGGEFFKEFQKKNVIRMLQETVETIIHEWLKTDDEHHTKLNHLQQLAEMPIDSIGFPVDSLFPDFILRFWLDPDQAMSSLGGKITKEEARHLIRETAKKIQLGPVSNAYP